jgi:hypothetical protein
MVLSLFARPQLALCALAIATISLPTNAIATAHAPPTSSLSTHMGALTTDCLVYVADGYDRADYKSSWCTGTPEGAGDPIPVSVINVDGKPIEATTADAYVVMANAAANDPVNPVVFNLEVGFRTMAKQMEHYQCDQCVNAGTGCGSCTYDVGAGPKSCGSCNDAACPGKSRHQMGMAVDIKTGCSQFDTSLAMGPQIAACEDKSDAFKWLMAHGNSYGFFRTYDPEAWHWVYQPWENPGPGGGPCTGSDPQDPAPPPPSGTSGHDTDPRRG